MGQCLSMVGVSPPKCELPIEEVVAKTKELLEPLPEQYKEVLEKVTKDYESHKSKSPDSDFEAKATDKKKNPLVVGKIAKGVAQDAAEKELKTIAGKILAKGEFAVKTSEEVWATVEPKIDEQRPEKAPDFLWDKAKEQVQGKVEDEVSKQVEAAVDKMVLAKGSQQG